MMKTGIASIALLALLAGCAEPESVRHVEGGDPKRGKLLLRQFGCGACHVIPGVATADGTVGPPLNHIARRVYIAGVANNSPANMIAFIRDPQAFDPRTAMPDLGVTEAHARDMAAYLYTLR